MENTTPATTNATASQLEAFKKATEALRLAAAPLLKMDRTKIEDSEVKFLLIRATRADHLAREVKSGKSQRA